jgi:PhnB protein
MGKQGPQAKNPQKEIETMKVNTYLNFPGTCEEAIRFYEQHLGAKVLFKSSFKDMPQQGAPQNLPPGLNPNGILHARFTLGDTVLMASDGPPEKCLPMRSAYLTLSVDSNEEAERIYAALTEGGEVFMAIGETFFAHRFGQLRDKFGINWMVIHEKPMGSH